MKTIAFMLGLLNPMVGEDLMKVDISVCETVKSVHMYVYDEQDKLTKINNYSIEYNGDIVSLYLKEYKDYQLVINDVHWITITPMAYEPIDERDFSISCDGTYDFAGGVLFFHLDNVTSLK